MVVLGVDQVTIVVSVLDISIYKRRGHQLDWVDIAGNIIQIIDKTLMLPEIFGTKVLSQYGKVAGYTTGYRYGVHPFNFTVCFHEAYWQMGVAINFSAQALAYYREQYHRLTGAKTEVYDMLRCLSYELGENTKVQLSRIDIYADFINEGINVNDLKNDLVSGKYQVWMTTGKRNVSRLSYYTKDSRVDTIYIGSKGKNIRTMLRIYNKRLEQIQQNGTRYDDAIKCKDWVRMENEIRGKYAHSLTQELMKINEPDELCDLIGTCLLNKYQFKSEDGSTHKITFILAECVKEQDYYFSDVRYKDMALQESYLYLIKHSGLIPFLYKLMRIDEKSYDWFINNVKTLAQKYEPNKDCEYWMKMHFEDYKKNGVHIGDYDTTNKKEVEDAKQQTGDK